MRIDRAKLAYELAKRELRQKRLAEMAGVSRVTLSYINCGKSCTPEIAGRIARALNMPLEELMEQDVMQL